MEFNDEESAEFFIAEKLFEELAKVGVTENSEQNKIDCTEPLAVCIELNGYREAFNECVNWMCR